MSKWYLMTLLGKDKAGIVSHVTSALFDGGCNLGEVAMLRVEGSMALTLMVQFDGRKSALADTIQTVTDSLGLEMQIIPVEAKGMAALKSAIEIINRVGIEVSLDESPGAG